MTREGDLISRQAVLDLVADYDLSMGQVVRGIHALPSVNPQEPKTDNDLDMKLKLMEANINGYTQGLKDASNTEQEPCKEGEYLKSAIRISKNIPKEMVEKVFFDTQAKMEVQND